MPAIMTRDLVLKGLPTASLETATAAPEPAETSSDNTAAVAFSLEAEA